MKWLILVLLLPIILLAGALLLNRAPLWLTPGPLVRLQLYLTTHTAETRPDHERPELRPLLLHEPLTQARERVIAAMRRLDWQQISPEGDVVRAVVVTPLWRFKDDVEVRLQQIAGGIQVNIRSQSRVGKGDLAANTRHILDLFHQLEVSGG
ncbi:MAG: DUF1499 domain-containing protein [Chromatiales bacterium]|jgi:uncharacterized protein (DUF1499 family)